MEVTTRDFHFFLLGAYFANAVAGILFLRYSSSEYDCKNEDFKSWGYVTGISCLFFSVLAILYVSLLPCSYQFFGKFLQYVTCACLMNSLICLIGLNSSIDEKCAELASLSKTYLIVISIIYTIIIMLLCFIICIFSASELPSVLNEGFATATAEA